jgi:hypothetical protein
MNPVLQHREWLIQPDALHAISASYQAQGERAGFFSHQGQQNSLLSVEDGIGVVAIEGPILRKADLFAKMFYGATSSEDNPHFPALRSTPMALSGASHRKQTPSSSDSVQSARQRCLTDAEWS